MEKIKKFLILIMAIVAMLCFAVACDKDSGNTEELETELGTYYAWSNYEYDEDNWIKLSKGNKWSDSDDLKGTYAIEDGGIFFFLSQIADMPLTVGEISDGAIALGGFLESTYYCKKGKMPPGVGTQGLEYTVNEEGTYDVSLGTAKGDIYIPDVYNKVPVTGIKAEGFKDSSITSITIPYYITNIGERAFYNCTKLKTIKYNAYMCDDLIKTSNVFYNVGKSVKGGTKVTVGENVSVIPQYLFYVSSSSNSPKIVSVEFKKEGLFVEIKEYAFANCENLKLLNLPEKIKNLSETAIENCSNLQYNEFENAYYLGNEQNPYLVLIKAKSTEITSCVIPNSTKIIFSKAFKGCSALQNLTIGENVTNLNESLFVDCSNLIYYEQDNALYLGSNSNKTMILIKIKDKSITSFTVPETTKSVSASAFENCSALTEFTLSKSVNEINTDAFKNCSALNKFVYTGTLNDWCNIRFKNAYANPLINGVDLVIGTEKITEVDLTLYQSHNFGNTFSGCVSLTRIILPYDIKVINDKEFYGCSALTEINIPNGVEGIGTDAFNGCASLETIIVPNTVMNVGKNSFYNCSSIKNITCPIFVINSISKSSLQNVIITSGEEIDSRAFYNCDLLNSVTISNSVTSIGEQAFYNCDTLTSITITDSITKIEESAFSGCSSLKNVNYTGDLNSWVHINFSNYSANPLVNGASLFINGKIMTNVNITDVSNIYDYAFYGCNSITSVTIGESVTSIGDSAFGYCNYITSVNYTGDINGWAKINFSDAQANPLCYIDIKDFYIDEKNVSSVITLDNVESVGSYAFYGCKWLRKVILGDMVKGIGERAFFGCNILIEIYNKSDNLTIIAGDSNNGYLGYYALNVYTETEGSNKLNIDENGFVMFKKGEQVELIGYEGSAINITIPDSVTKIKGNVFKNNTKIKQLLVGDNVTEIEEGAFNGCSSLTQAVIGEGVERLTALFEGCYNLESLTIPFVGASRNESTYIDVKDEGNFTSYTFNSNRLFAILFGEGFQGNSAVQPPENEYYNAVIYTDYYIPGEFASTIWFYIPKNLHSVTVTSGKIHYEAFAGCSFTNIVLGGEVTSIEPRAFSSRISSVSFENTNGWFVTQDATATSGTSVSVTDISDNVTNLTSTYREYYWKRNV